MKKRCMILPVALILCFMVGCQDKEAMAELEEFKAQAAVEEQNKALVKRSIEAWEKGDFEAFMELLAPGFAFYYPSGSTTPMSQEETIEIGKMRGTSHQMNPLLLIIGDKGLQISDLPPIQ